MWRNSLPTIRKSLECFFFFFSNPVIGENLFQKITILPNRNPNRKATTTYVPTYASFREYIGHKVHPLTSLYDLIAIRKRAVSFLFIAATIEDACSVFQIVSALGQKQKKGLIQRTYNVRVNITRFPETSTSSSQNHKIWMGKKWHQKIAPSSTFPHHVCTDLQGMKVYRSRKKEREREKKMLEV